MNTRFFSSYSEWLNTLKQTRTDFAVRFLLEQHLDPLGINPDSAYVNTLDDVLTGEVGTSVSLFDEALACVEQKRLPDYNGSMSGTYTRQFSSAKEDRLKKMDIMTFEKVVINMVMELTGKAPMNLTRRVFKDLTLEDVKSALKGHLRDIDLDSSYITGFVDHQGELMALSSEPLPVYLLQRFKENEIPYFRKGLQPLVYTVAYSGAKEHVHPQLDAVDVNYLLVKLVPDFLA